MDPFNKRGLRLLAVLFVLQALALSACSPAEPTPPPRPTVIVITVEGPYYETFDEPTDWLLGEGQNSRGWIADGEYHLSIEEPRFIAWTHQKRAFGTGTYSVDASLSSGPEASAFGLLLQGASDLNSFIYVMITGDGRYDIGTCRRGCREQESLVDGFTLTYAILTGNRSNHLDVILREDTLSLVINGTQVSTINDVTLSEGILGFIGESSPYGGFEASFDNLRVNDVTSP